jgi:hypothetical protein
MSAQLKIFPCHKWKFKALENERGKSVRLYYRPNEDGNGFDFDILEETSVGGDKNFGDWDPEHSEVDVLFWGIAYWDGVRHLYMGNQATDNYGYLYYPDISDYVTYFKAISDLENEYCSEFKANV